MNVLRAVEWLKGKRPAPTPVSRFARLVASAKLVVAA
jgi:transposase